MAHRWIAAVRGNGRLRLHRATPLAADWAQVIEDAVTGFNRIARRSRLGVTFEFSDDPPGDDAATGSEVGIRVLDGEASYTFQGATYSASLTGAQMHGKTQLLRDGSSGEVLRAMIFLPANPLLSTPSAVRPAGANVRLVIAFHELVHACGLTDADHAGAAFDGHPSVDFGRTPRRDRVVSGRRRMPPLVLEADTIRQIAALWSGD